MEIKQDNVSVFCLPDCAMCDLCNMNPNEMDECPEGNEECNGYCSHYVEDEERYEFIKALEEEGYSPSEIDMKLRENGYY